MQEQLNSQLVEMEEQLDIMAGAIDVMQSSKDATVETIQTLKETQAKLSEACEALTPEIRDKFDEFAKQCKKLLDDNEELLQKLSQLDVKQFMELLERNQLNVDAAITAASSDISTHSDEVTATVAQEIKEHITQNADDVSQKANETISEKIKTVETTLSDYKNQITTHNEILNNSVNSVKTFVMVSIGIGTIACILSAVGLFI